MLSYLSYLYNKLNNLVLIGKCTNDSALVRDSLKYRNFVNQLQYLNRNDYVILLSTDQVYPEYKKYPTNFTEAITKSLMTLPIRSKSPGASNFTIPQGMEISVRKQDGSNNFLVEIVIKGEGIDIRYEKECGLNELIILNNESSWPIISRLSYKSHFVKGKNIQIVNCNIIKKIFILSKLLTQITLSVCLLKIKHLIIKTFFKNEKDREKFLAFKLIKD